MTKTDSFQRPARLLRLREVVARTGLSRSTVYVRVTAGDFPAPVAIGGCRVAWREDEVNDWIASRPRVALGREGC
ncbi:MAG: AlpA family transcriptional regulator [Nitrospirae bacterium]|nr:AlpA family transcriptional regulator [Nitrospirota bacterium]